MVGLIVVWGTSETVIEAAMGTVEAILVGSMKGKLRGWLYRW